jgi:hypothetical protein
MRVPAIALLLGGLISSAGVVFPGAVRGESGPESRPIGQVVTVTGSVTVEHVGAVIVQAALGSGVGQTKVGDFVYKGDVVQTGADGRIGITFTDGTAFNLSSNARMVLNEFVYDPNGKSNSTLFSLSKGTFTFIAGKVAKTGDMKIDTPVATMGIRGTTPHVEISDNGTVSFSTLIEEGKNRVPAGKRAAAGNNQRQARTGSSSVEQGGSNLDKNLSIKLKICRDC